MKLRHALLIVFSIVLFALACPSCLAKTVYVRSDGSNSNNGTSWQLAKKTVQAGVDASVSGDEVWVAKGTYAERIDMKSGVGLYGGFVGTETIRSQRNWNANVTTLQGTQGGNVVGVSGTATATTVIDGFTIRNGGNSGIYCGGSPTISNNTITGNTSTFYGGGIYCYNSSPTITNNTITGNTASYGGGISCSGGSPKIANNTVAGNHATYGGGMYCLSSSSLAISNNTITGNFASTDGGGILSTSSSPTLSNNIVAFNASGICVSGGAPVLRNNCVYNPDGYNYSGLTAGTGDFSADPRLVAVEHRDLHIQPDSPCVDAGNDSAVQPGWVDMDGQARIQGAHVDVGADESDGTTWTFTPVAVRVSPTGNDSNDGSSWAAAKRTVQAGANAASALGGEVWVAAGTYNERIVLPAYAYLFGGFAGSETSREQRDWAANKSVLDGGGVEAAIRASVGYKAICVDGFTIRNRGAEGIRCERASPTISNNTLTGNSVAVYCSNSSPTICRNTITRSSGNGIYGYGGGIFCSNSSPTITSNTITGNTASYGGGIYCTQSSPTISNNTISGNTARGDQGYGGGIYCTQSSPTISNNTITGNGAAGGGAICCYSSSPTISNNTITGNMGAVNGGGIQCSSSSAPTISNNIVAFNSSGVYVSTGSVPVLGNNCVYNPGGYDYSGVSPGTCDFSADPKLCAAEYGQVHIQPDSPCIDAGNDGVVQPGWVDIDGQARIQGAHVDIGADESDGTTWVFTPAVVHVSTTGSDSNDGSSWAFGKRTVQAGANAASAVGGEVWVAAGTYNERIVLPAYACLYGGFAGTETSRGERNWRANVSVLDGAGYGTTTAVVTVQTGYKGTASGIDGFTIRNGYGYSGGGVYCSACAPAISNNTIAGNTATNGAGVYCVRSSPAITNNTIAGNAGNTTVTYGGGIYCYYASPIISNNTITGNCISDDGGGIYCRSDSAPTISNNTITGNTASTGGGGICSSGSSPTIVNNTINGNSAANGGGILCALSSAPAITNNTIVGNTASTNGGGIFSGGASPNISNNIVAFNSSGVYKTSASGTPVLSNDCVYGNTSYNYSGITAGTGDISADPLFVDRANGNYHLTGASPCIDRGSNGAPGLPLFDMDGEGRKFRTVDMGADEFWPTILNAAESKKAPDGAIIRGEGAIVSAKFADFFYVEDEDRSSGLRIEKAGHPALEDMKVTISGKAGTSANGERCIIAEAVTPSEETHHIKPVAMPNRSLGGGSSGLQSGVWSWRKVMGVTDPQWLESSGLNNIGLLVTIWGNVTFAGADYFYVDDGSKLNDDSGHIGVKVSAPGMSVPSSGCVIVTGISSCEKKGSDLIRVLRATQIVPVP